MKNFFLLVLALTVVCAVIFGFGVFITYAWNWGVVGTGMLDGANVIPLFWDGCLLGLFISGWILILRIFLGKEN